MKILTATCVALFVASVITACSGGSTIPTTSPDAASPPSSTVADAGGGETKDGAVAVATPQVIFAGTTENGSGIDCRDAGELFAVGDYGNDETPPTPVQDGASAGQGTASVACTVKPGAAGAFAVDATVQLTGATGGLFKVDGTFALTGDQTDIHVTASSRRSANSYEQKDRKCVARYSQPNQGVGAGRVWAEVDCPAAENLGDPSRACRVRAQFRFENCVQK